MYSCNEYITPPFLKCQQAMLVNSEWTRSGHCLNPERYIIWHFQPRLLCIHNLFLMELSDLTLFCVCCRNRFRLNNCKYLLHGCCSPGGLFSSIFGGLFGTREMRILILGLDGAGKTTILYRLQVGEVVTTIPSMSFYFILFLELFKQFRQRFELCSVACALTVDDRSLNLQWWQLSFFTPNKRILNLVLVTGQSDAL